MEISFLQAGDLGVELLKYHAPAGDDANKGVRNCDVGAARFCLAVEAVDAMHEDFRDDLRIINPPQELPSGSRVASLHDPEGNVVEFYQSG